MPQEPTWLPISLDHGSSEQASEQASEQWREREEVLAGMRREACIDAVEVNAPVTVTETEFAKQDRAAAALIKCMQNCPK